MNNKQAYHHWQKKCHTEILETELVSGVPTETLCKFTLKILLEKEEPIILGSLLQKYYWYCHECMF